MSYSSGTSQDGSIKALLRRLDAADPLGDECIRTDPLQVLREARMKVAARARTGEDEPSNNPGGGFAGEFLGLAPWHEVDAGDVASSIDKPAAARSAEAEQKPSKGELVIVDAVQDGGVQSRRWPMVSAGLAAVIACAGLASLYGPALLDGLDQTGIELSALVPGAISGDAPEAAQAGGPIVEGVGRFTIAAVSLVGANAASEPSRGGAGEPAVQPVPVAEPGHDETTRIDADAGDQVPLPIELNPALGTGEVAAIVLRGLPPDYNITGAMPSGDSSWVLSPDGLGAARIVIPAGGAGDVTVTAELFDMSAQSVGSSRFVLNVKPTEVVRTLDPQRARALLARGQGLLQAGDIAGARLLFEMAAESGVAEGAYALGETFDPLQLAARGAVGLTGDAARARFWYAHASENGVMAARERLVALGGK